MQKILTFWIIIFVPLFALAQDQTNFTQFYLNPYLLNPSYVGTEGRSALFLAYRNQWTGIEGAPQISGLSYHTAFKSNVAIGLSAFNDQRGILNSSSASLTFGYTLTMSKNKYVRFGMSAGMSSNGLDIDQIENLNDPALLNILERNNTLLGNAGMSLHLNNFHLGVALPNIFEPVYVSPDAINIAEVAPFESIIVNVSNRFYFNKDKHVFEPYLVYRYGTNLPSQLEAAAVLTLNHAVWFGGSYKQDFGISALGGIKLQNLFLMGYSYSLKNTGINQLASPTHEVHIGLLLGKKRENKPVYSFVNTEKEKEKKKTPAQLAEERRKAQEEEKRKQEALALQQELEEKKAEEARQKQRSTEERLADEQRRKEEVAALLREEELKAQRSKEEQAQEKAEAERTQREEQARRQQEQQRQQETAAQIKQREEEEAQRRIREAEEQKAREEAAKKEIDRQEAERKAREEAARQAREELQAKTQPERHETVRRGTHLLELEEGNYVVIGVFGVFENAVRYSDNLYGRGFNAKYGFLSNKGMYYVYIERSEDINSAREARNRFRRISLFKDAWLLTVE
jgi:type IX secretion system PorP/SprF family membrane protein